MELSKIVCPFCIRLRLNIHSYFTFFTDYDAFLTWSDGKVFTKVNVHISEKGKDYFYANAHQWSPKHLIHRVQLKGAWSVEGLRSAIVKALCTKHTYLCQMYYHDNDAASELSVLHYVNLK